MKNNQKVEIINPKFILYGWCGNCGTPFSDLKVEAKDMDLKTIKNLEVICPYCRSVNVLKK